RVWARQDVDTVRISEGQRDLKQARAALDLKREPMDTMTTHPRRGDLHDHLKAPTRRHLSLVGLDLYLKVRGRYSAQLHVARCLCVAVAHLGLQLHGLVARDVAYALRLTPQHLEASGSNPGNGEARHRPGDGEPDEDGAAPRQR